MLALATDVVIPLATALAMLTIHSLFELVQQQPPVDWFGFAAVMMDYFDQQISPIKGIVETVELSVAFDHHLLEPHFLLASPKSCEFFLKPVLALVLVHQREF